MDILQEMNADLEWRLSELASIKAIPLMYPLNDYHKKIIIKYSVPAIYSIWEGFVRKLFESYAKYLNSKQISYANIHQNILTHGISSNDKLKLDNPRSSFSKQREHTLEYQAYISDYISIGLKIPTKSNVNYDVINELLERFAMNQIDVSYKNGLNKLLKFRNSIAHGDNSIPVKHEDIVNFTILINNLMSELIIKLEEAITEYKYLKNSIN